LADNFLVFLKTRKKKTEMNRSLILISLLIFLCGNTVAQINVFRPAVIVKHNGAQMECQAKYPNAGNAKEITCKTDKDDKILKMKSAEIKTIRYSLKDDKVVEKVYIPYLNSVEIEKGKQNYSEPAWMDVLVRGKMTLYLRVVNQIYSKGRSFTYYYYYCKRENEEVASEIAYTNFRDGSQNFHTYAPKYFSDHTTISEKIKNNENGYTARYIEAIVEE
jgi:hypothetical protein